MTFQWKQATAFYDRVERLNLHGLHFQHVLLCQRRAWMYLHGVNFAQWYGRVATGAAKHETSYQRDKSTNGLFGLAPDRIDWDNHIVYENKGTAGAVEACDLQTAFYAVMLSIATGKEWQGVSHILTNRKKRVVSLSEARLDTLWKASDALQTLALCESVPKAEKQPLCQRCSFSKFCGYDE